MRSAVVSSGILVMLGVLPAASALPACGQASSGPPLVASKPGAGTSAAEGSGADAGTDAGGGDAGFADAGVGTACYTATSSPCVNPIAGSLFTAPTCPGGVVADACPLTGVIGCCTLATGGITEESCFYGASGLTYSTSAGCSTANGTWTLTP